MSSTHEVLEVELGTQFKIKGVDMTFVISDIEVDMDQDYIDLGWSPTDIVAGYKKYTASIEARRVQ